jgi:methionyl-tRNA formyltransferase
VAQGELQLKTHEIDTFTGWTPPLPINLVIAVSFGLFVPPRILNGAKYGGLNVHPSLLPDLRGPAPIHHTLLKQRSKTGITIQTLHPEHFDQGQILAQTPAPGLDVPEDATSASLIASLGEKGGDMLVNLLISRAYIPPLHDAGWYSSSSGPVSYAEKLTKTHSYIDSSAASAQDILTRHRALGDLWCYLPEQKSGERVILHKIQRTGVVDTTRREPGFVVLEGLVGVGIKTADGSVLDVTSCTVSGGTKKQGVAKMKRILT